MKSVKMNTVSNSDNNLSIEKEIFNQEIVQYNIALVKEAVKHFSTCKFVPSKSDPYDERHFFHFSDVQAFLDKNSNPFVDYRILYNDSGEIFCYEIFRNKSEGPVYKKKISNI